MSETIDFPTIFAALQRGPLTAVAVEQSFDAILQGAWSSHQIAAFLAALRIRGESAEVLLAAAQAMRRVMVPVRAPSGVVLDTCGTGGDGSGTINLSTAAAILCAADGVVVAKHGNRAVSSQAGSADVLLALGLPIELPASASERLLAEVGIAFLLAPVHHPAMRHVMPVRRELGVRTIFNCLGPLANPAHATRQLVGAFSDELRPLLAQSLSGLGTERAWVVRGEDGLDEVSPYGPSRVTEVSRGTLRELRIAPEDFGLRRSEPSAAKGGDAKHNAEVIETILKGEAHPARDAVVLNAAAALAVARDLELPTAATRVTELLASGRGYERLTAWRAASSALV